MSNDRDSSSELLVNHKSKDTHHGGTSVVQLNGTLLKLGILIKCIPSEVDGAVTEVTDEVTGGGTVGTVLHDSKLQEANEGKHLEGTGNGDVEGSGPALADVGELGPGKVNISREAESSAGGNLAQEGELANTAVLQLNVTEAVESLLVGIIEQAKGVEESKRILLSKETATSIKIREEGVSILFCEIYETVSFTHTM